MQQAAGPSSASRQEVAVPPPKQVVPDGCNVGTVLRVTLAVNAVVALAD